MAVYDELGKVLDFIQKLGTSVPSSSQRQDDFLS